MSRGRFRIVRNCRSRCGCGVRGDLEIRYRSVLVDLECSDDATSYFSLVALSANSREELVVVCSACRFQIATSTSIYDGWTLARSSGCRLRFWFASEFLICVFTSRHFWSSSCRTASFSRTSSWTCLWTPSGALSRTLLRLPPGPPLQKWPISYWQPYTGRPLLGQIQPGPLLTSPRPLLVLTRDVSRRNWNILQNYSAVKNSNKTYCFSTDPLTFCFTFFLIFSKCASRPRAVKNSNIKKNMKFLDVYKTNGTSMILRRPEVVFVILTLFFRCVIASCEWDLGVGLCCRRRLDFDF